MGCPVSAFIATSEQSGVLPDEESRARHAPSERGGPDSLRRSRPHPEVRDDRSPFGVEQSPGHGTYLIGKTLERRWCPSYQGD